MQSGFQPTWRTRFDSYADLVTISRIEVDGPIRELNEIRSANHEAMSTNLNVVANRKTRRGKHLST